MNGSAPRLLVVAHGTASASGRATVAALVDAVASRRPDHTVGFCYLDVVDPRLADVLDERPTVVVPALLSTGYHVQADIPAAVADYPGTRVARHLGPHPLLADALAERLGAGTGPAVLVAAASTRPDAALEVQAQAALLGQHLGVDVTTATVADDLAAVFADTGAGRVATYLLAEGRFTDTVRAAAGPAVTVAPALGAHPAVVELVWLRYDEERSRGVR